MVGKAALPLVCTVPPSTFAVPLIVDAHSIVPSLAVMFASPVMLLDNAIVPVLFPFISTVVTAADDPTVTVPFNREASSVVIAVLALPFSVKNESEAEPPVILKSVQVPVMYASVPPDANSQRGPSRSRDVVLLPIVPVKPSPTRNVIPVNPVAAPPMVSLLVLMIKVSSLPGAVPPQLAAVVNVLVVADSPPVQINVFGISQNPLLASIR